MRIAAKRIRFWALVSLGLLALIAIAGALVLRSDWFRDKVRERIVFETERATGGRAELGAFRFSWSRMRAEVEGFVLRGLEPASDPPLFQASRIVVDLRLTSIWRPSVDLRALTVEQPRVRIVFGPDGKSNLPSPKVRRTSDRTWAEEFLRLAIDDVNVRDGWLEIDQRRVPLNFQAENLAAQLTYEASGPRYTGSVKADALQIQASQFDPQRFALDAAVAIEPNRVRLPKLQLTTGGSTVELTGELTDLRSPKADLRTKALLQLADFVPVFDLPLRKEGTVALDGRVEVSFTPQFRYRVTGPVDVRNVAIQRPEVAIAGVDLRGNLELTPEKLSLTGTSAAVAGGRFEGLIELEEWRRYRAEGRVSGLAVNRLTDVAKVADLPWNALLAGPVSVSGSLPRKGASGDLEARGRLTVTPAGDSVPLEGVVEASYRQRENEIAIRQASLATPMTRLDAEGVLGSRVQFRMRTQSLEELQPWIVRFSGERAELPVELKGGSAAVEGTVAGPLDNAQVSGTASLSKFEASGVAFEEASAAFEAARSRVRISNAVVRGQHFTAEGNWSADAGSGEFRNAPQTGSIRIRGASLGPLLKQAGATLDVSGTGTGSFTLAGTIANPRVEGTFAATGLTVVGEKVDRATGSLRYAGNRLDLTALDVTAGAGRARLAGFYQHAPKDFKSGTAEAAVTVQNLRLSSLGTLKERISEWDGVAGANLRIAAELRNGELQLTSVAGDAALERIVHGAAPVGRVALTASTANRRLSARVIGVVADSKIEGGGEWSLAGRAPGSGSIRFSPLSFASAQVLATAGREQEPPPQGHVQGSLEITGPLLDPDLMRATLTIDQLRVTPRPEQIKAGGPGAQNLILTNAAPIVVTLTRDGARFADARLEGPNTRLEAGGFLSFANRNATEIRANGTIDLAVLQLLNPDLLAKGQADVRATVRGSLERPLVNGRLELRDASLYLADIPNGVDHAFGVINFDQSRATIEKLTAETGGGKIEFSGFVGVTARVLTYRLQAQARQVRVRYPEDFSFVFNADLNLAGTSERSLLSGSVSVVRAAFNPRSDLADLFTQTIRPTPSPATPNEYLRGMQLDVRIESDPGLQVQTSLTRDVQAEANLQLRGTPVRPILLGEITVNEGEVQVFGTRYTVNRGEIRFLNPTKIEPVFDMDLETRARGITVNISFRGSPSKVDVTYRSDPPLQTSEIIALLAVGRDPNVTGNRIATPVGGGAPNQLGAVSVLSEALASQVSGRLERFFGVSRVKIDPQMTGVETLPQARLTVEQQVSKDITITYITNLTRTQEQNIRVQWDLNREWSVLAVREETGAIGLFFQYRKRFK